MLAYQYLTLMKRKLITNYNSIGQLDSFTVAGYMIIERVHTSNDCMCIRNVN